MSKSPSCMRVSAFTLLTVALLSGYVFPATQDLTLSRLVWDFESIEQGQAKTQKIVMKNSGDQPLKIEKIELPDGLSVKPSLDNTEIQPEKELEVEFTYDAKGILGRIQQYAYIFSSSSDKKKIVPFTIKGEVFAKGEPRLRVTPPTWNFGTVTVGDSKEQTFSCENFGTADLKIEKVQLYDSRFRVVRNITKETLGPGEKADFILGVTGRHQGRYDTEFYVKSNGAGGNFTKISIEGFAVTKPRGLVVSSNLSSITNNTFSKFEVTRTDKDGKSDTLTVENNSTKAFSREPATRPTPTDLADYTLTIKLVKPPIPTATPPKEKPSGEKPVAPAAKPGEKPAEEKPSEEVTAPPPEKPAAEPEKPEPSEEPEPKEEKKPAKPEEEKKPAPAAPSEEKESEKPPQKPVPEPEETKPAEGKTPPAEQPSPAKPEEKKQGQPKEEKELAPTAPSDKEEPEKPPEKPVSKPEETKPSEGESPAPSAESANPTAPKEPPNDPAKKAPDDTK